MSSSWEQWHGVDKEERPISVSPLTTSEKRILSKADNVRCEADKTAGVVLRAAVSIARYQRSRETAPEHFDRLIRSTTHFAASLVSLSVVTGDIFPATTEDINAKVGSIDWDIHKGVPRPIISEVTDPGGAVHPTLEFN